MAGNLGSKPFGVVDDEYLEPNGVSFPGGSEILIALRAAHPSVKKVLLIEGASSRGRTITQFKSEFACELKYWEVRVAVLFVAATSDAYIDFVGQQGPEKWPKRMPWHSSESWNTALRRDA